MPTSENSCKISKELGYVSLVKIVPRIIKVVFTSRIREDHPLDHLDHCEVHGVVRRGKDGRQYVLGSGPDNKSGDETYHNVTDVFDLAVSKRPDCDLVRRD